MLSFSDARAKLVEHGSRIGVPAQAVLTEMEKRSIELADRGEIEPVESEGPPRLTETVCWVGRFTEGFLFWELAVDERGTLIRVRKSR